MKINITDANHHKGSNHNHCRCCCLRGNQEEQRGKEKRKYKTNGSCHSSKSATTTNVHTCSTLYIGRDCRCSNDGTKRCSKSKKKKALFMACIVPSFSTNPVLLP